MMMMMILPHSDKEIDIGYLCKQTLGLAGGGNVN